MGIAMFVLGVAIPALIREPAKGRYTPLTKARSHWSLWWTAFTTTVTCCAAVTACTVLHACPPQF
jgi:hypothetical protein